MEAPPKRRAAFCLRGAWLEGKARGVYPDGMAVRDPGEVAGWLPEAGRAGVGLGRASLPLLSGELLRPWGEIAPAADGRGDELENAAAADALRQKKAEEKSRLRIAVWESFMREERRELQLRRDGQLATLLAEALPGEAPEVVRRLAREDQRQAKDGLVALMSNGRVSYKSLDGLSEGDMPARIAASRARTTWLKERRDGWLRRGEGLRGDL